MLTNGGKITFIGKLQEARQNKTYNIVAKSILNVYGEK